MWDKLFLGNSYHFLDIGYIGKKSILSDKLIQEKARRIQVHLNEQISIENQMHLEFQ